MLGSRAPRFPESMIQGPHSTKCQFSQSIIHRKYMQPTLLEAFQVGLANSQLGSICQPYISTLNWHNGYYRKNEISKTL